MKDYPLLQQVQDKTYPQAGTNRGSDFSALSTLKTNNGEPN